MIDMYQRLNTLNRAVALPGVKIIPVMVRSIRITESKKWKFDAIKAAEKIPTNMESRMRFVKKTQMMVSAIGIRVHAVAAKFTDSSIIKDSPLHNFLENEHPS